LKAYIALLRYFLYHLRASTTQVSGQAQMTQRTVNMQTMKEWPKRIKQRMKVMGLTQEALASKMGITRGAVTHYLSGRRVPPMKQLEKMADILQTDAAWLQFGIARELDPVTNTFSYKILDELPTLHPIPIISWEQIDIIADTSLLDRSKVTDWVPRMYNDGLQSFALYVKGDAMTSPYGHMDSFREGDLVQFDNDIKPEHGKYVIAILPEANEAIFRQYVIDGGIQYLKPLNPQYPLIQIDEKTRICGVMIYHIGC
jgi:SOS-response transcriptional repressor LexA